MAKNQKFWNSFMANENDLNSDSELEPLEEGLESLTWFENSKRIVKKKWKKTRETFGEEVGNSITAGVVAIYVLGLIPFASVHSYIKAPEGMGLKNSFAISAFLLSMFLTLLFSTIFHFMKHGTAQKRVMDKMNRIIIYYAIWGAFFPVCLSIVGGKLGLGILIALGCLTLAGTLFTALTYPLSKKGSAVCNLIYFIMGALAFVVIKPFYAGVSKACFWLVLAGFITYVVGLFFYSGKKFKFSHMVWHFFVMAAAICQIVGMVYFL